MTRSDFLAIWIAKGSEHGKDSFVPLSYHGIGIKLTPPPCAFLSLSPQVQVALQCIVIFQKFLYVFQVQVWLVPIPIVLSVVQPLAFSLLLTITPIPPEGQRKEPELPLEVQVPWLPSVQIPVAPLQKVSFAVKVASVQRTVPH